MKILISESHLRHIVSEQSGLNSYSYGMTPGGNYVKGGSEEVTNKIINQFYESQTYRDALMLGSIFIPVVGTYISLGVLGSDFIINYKNAKTDEDKERVVLSYIISIAIGAGLGVAFKSVAKLGEKGMNALAKKISVKKVLLPEELPVIMDLSKHPDLVKQKIKPFVESIKKVKPKGNSNPKSNNIEFVNLPRFNVNGVKFYHGTTSEITSKNQLNPLFRETESYVKNQKNVWSKRSHGSSDGGVGVYFGRDATKIASEDAGQYASETAYSSTHGHGFMYEMELKPNAKVVKYGHYEKLTKSNYQMLRLQNVDAVANSSTGSINLINPNAVKSWKLINKWEVPFDVTLYNQSQKFINNKRFLNWSDYSDYLEGLGVQKNTIVPGSRTFELPNKQMVIVNRPTLKQ